MLAATHFQPSSSYIDICHVPFSSYPDARGTLWCRRTTHKVLHPIRPTLTHMVSLLWKWTLWHLWHLFCLVTKCRDSIVSRFRRKKSVKYAGTTKSRQIPRQSEVTASGFVFPALTADTAVCLGNLIPIITLPHTETTRQPARLPNTE